MLRCLLVTLTVASGVARAHLRHHTNEDSAACSCSQCIGERRNEGGDGTVSFQCFPRSSGLAECHQAESTGEQVVQSAEFLSYDRFCIYTCKPLLRDEIKSIVDCVHLSHQEITHDAQSPSSNGKEIVYEAHPLTKVGPISKLVPLPQASMLGVSASSGSSDPVASIRGAFAKLRNLETQHGGISAYGLPNAAQAPSLCVCHCGSKVNRFRQTESDGVIYPKPHKIPGLSVTSPRSVLVEPMQPPMPPPPPADLPKPWLPTGSVQELPALPQAPVEVYGPLPLEELGIQKEKATSFLQEGQQQHAAQGNPVSCNCIC